MELKDWITEVGGVEAAAALLEENERTVYSWFRLERAPSLKAACKIVRTSKWKVDFNGIYQPLCVCLHGLELPEK